MTKEEIKEINGLCPDEQGIFVEGYGIPVHIKEPCVYSRWPTGGRRGGSCWGYTSYRFDEDEPRNKHEVLDIILKRICPIVSYLQFKEIEKLWCNNEDTDYEYYGNSTDYHVDYIPLSNLEKLIESFKEK